MSPCAGPGAENPGGIEALEPRASHEKPKGRRPAPEIEVR